MCFSVRICCCASINSVQYLAVIPIMFVKVFGGALCPVNTVWGGTIRAVCVDIYKIVNL